MAVTHKLYGPIVTNIYNGTVDLGAHTFKVALMSSAHTLNQDHENWADVSANEISSTGDYTAGGITLAIASSQMTYATRVTSVICSSETVFSTSGTISANYAVVYGSTNNKLVSCVDFGGAEASVDGEYKITWTDSKLKTVTVSA